LSKSVALLLVLVLLVAPCIISVKPAWAAKGSWTSMSPIRTARSGLGVAVVEGKIYAIGGGNSTSRYLGTNEMYDHATDTWTTKASMPTPRDRMVANVVDGKIYVISGGEASAYPLYVCSSKNEVYDPETDTWTEKTSLPTAVLGAASAVVDGKIYVLGGQAGLFLGGWYDFNQVYDVKNDTWSTAAPVPVGFDRAAAGATTGVFAKKNLRFWRLHWILHATESNSSVRSGKQRVE
jgi:hypothetical protein